MATTTKTTFNSKFEYQVIENALREKISDLIDMAFEAYLKAGYPMGEYTQNQFFLNLLFQSVNQLDEYSDKRIGGLQLIVRFMQRLIDHYNTVQADG